MNNGSFWGKQRGCLWISLGLLLIVLGAALTLWNLFDAQRAERSARRIICILEEASSPAAVPEAAAVENCTPDIPDPHMEMPVKTVDGLTLIGILEIPALELELPVISQWSYHSLQTAPCRYSGSVYLNNLVLCGHNYPSHFGNLGKLQPGDTISFTDMDGNTYLYEMSQRETLESTDVEAMETGDWDLTLFTCTPGGRNRVTLRCNRV